MASSRKKTEIRMAPKHLDKMLFINYKEEEKLQHRLQTLTNSSRLRSYELDREKVQVHKEMRLNRRRNSAPSLHGAPPASALPMSPRGRGGTGPPTRDSSTSRPGGLPGSRRGSTATAVDPVNEYLLNEFRRVSEVIPSILKNLTKDDKQEEEGEEGAGRGGGEGGRKAGGRKSSLSKAGDKFSQLAAPRVRLDPDLARFASKEADGQVIIGNIVDNIRAIKALREEIAGRKRLEVNKAKTNFKDLLKNIREEEGKGSDSDTFTDGACVLLRRKMHKARRASMPAVDQPEGEAGATGGGDPGSRRQSVAPATGPGTVRPIHISRSTTSLGSIGRQSSRDFQAMLEAMLHEEDRQMTELKVANELQQYDRICARIDNFLEGVQSTRRSSLPVLPRSQSQGEEAAGGM